MSDERSNGRTGKTVEAFKEAILNKLYYSKGTTIHSASRHDAYVSLALTVRDHLIENWRKTTEAHYAANPKFVYYLSAEYLLGSQLKQNLVYTSTDELARQALAEFNLDLDDFILMDIEPGLGNGGLGRLAACYIDSLATMNIPAVGYGIRYEFGIFKQSFRDGWQLEKPDEWLFTGNPWEFQHPDNMVNVNFGGRTVHYMDESGVFRVRWDPGYSVLGEPYHMLVPGYGTKNVNLLRLWRARATDEFDLKSFDVGDYIRAVEDKVYSENITKVLYPNDNTYQGKELRLKQQYFFVACSLRDIIRRFNFHNLDWKELPKKVVIQLNDTHPVIAIPELMRILIDEEDLDWDSAWEIVKRTFAYTCHTLLPEALEKWPVSLFERLLPRHLEIIYEINQRFLRSIRIKFPDDVNRLVSMSIIEEGDERQVRMAHLASVGSFSINGVAELQTDLLRQRTLKEFFEVFPEKFNNKTNGVTPRRFMRMANPALSTLISQKIGDGWLRDLTQLQRLESFISEPEFRETWQEVKRANKLTLARYIDSKYGLEINPDSIFDVMVKRLHEYKRQLLKTLHIVTLYNRLKANPDLDIAPRTFIFGAKAAPGYYMAKLIIKLINSIGSVINEDPIVNDRLKLVFLENFNVTLAEMIYPAADISEQISLAGKEASGTGNMKFALNGAITTGTLDGANIEIRERVGEENFFLFGLTADEVFSLRERGYNPLEYYRQNPELRAVIERISSGFFSDGDSNLFRPIIEDLVRNDTFMLFADYQSYIDCQEQAAHAYLDKDSWTRMSILNVARCGFFSSDRSIQQYIDDIWKVDPVLVE
jgi:starch phosphorylase